ncbi:MAG: hypothetical protein U1E13_07785 [Methylophilaceae bacterium]|nr:hypothetical protein [Erythrobacter sp.]MDZ4098590.1 hypothetical protein [Methylophilaceae bacterium]MDZ4273628.1 hypothetical protein [Erythrobacter sp.]
MANTNDPEFVGENPGESYLQVLIFHDFLAAHGVGPRELNSLMSAISKGDSFEDWLEREAGRIGLPDSVSTLAALWTAWLEGERIERQEFLQR